MKLIKQPLDSVESFSKVYTFEELKKLTENSKIEIKPNYGMSPTRKRDEEIVINGMNVRHIHKIIICQESCNSVSRNNEKYYNIICKFMDDKNRVVTYKVINKNERFMHYEGFTCEEFVIG